MGLGYSRQDDPQTSALVTSSSIPGILADLPISKSTLPPHDYIQRLIERFRESSSPECMPRVAFSPDKALCEYGSASYHLPGAYVDSFPCPHCTYKNEEGRTSFVEVFHFPNVHKPSVCATVTFVMPADPRRLKEPTECSVEIEFTKGCPKAPIAAYHSTRVVLHMDTDVFFEVLRFLSRSGLEKMLLVSRRLSHVIGGAEGSLQQRRSFYLLIQSMLSAVAHSSRADNSRAFASTQRGPLASAERIRRKRHPPLQWRRPTYGSTARTRVDIPLPVRIDWLKSLLHSMPLNSEIGEWCVSENIVGFDNRLTLARCALEPHRKLGRVQRLKLRLFTRDVTWAQLASLLNQPSIRGFSEIDIWTTTVAIDTTGLRTILSSWPTPKLTVLVRSGTEPQDALLTLPTQIIRDFVALRDVNSFVIEFSLRMENANISFPDMPEVDEGTDRRKRFRCQRNGEDTVARVSVYENPTARKCLSVVTFDQFRHIVLFFNGNVSLSYIASRFPRHSA